MATKRAALLLPAVKGHADAIARKYIVPGEGTLDMALMFVPSESVYYELLMLPDNKGQQLDSYCRGKKVIAVSPNTLYAHLCVIAMGLRGMQIEENATRIFASLSGMHKQMETFTEVFEKLGTHIKNSQQCLQRRRQAPGENTEHAGQPAGHQLHAGRAGSARHAGAADGFDVKAQRLGFPSPK